MNAIDIQPVFSTNLLDRMDHLRTDIFTNRNSKKDKYLLISQGEILLDSNRNCFIAGAELPDALLQESLCVFLGSDLGVNYFTLAISPEQAQSYEKLPLREFAENKVLPENQLGILAEANSLLSWHANHGFCAKCGTKSVVSYGGWRRDCPSCGTQHFPRTDPVVIMLVTHGDQCLLGRSAHFPEKRFSCLAGFMEPGETFEQAALRELWEEAGVKGEQVKYLLNQPWPFPSNLMIGVHIEAQHTELSIDYNELEEAIWVTKEEVNAVLNGETDRNFLLPSSVAIARNLLEYWVANR